MDDTTYVVIKKKRKVMKRNISSDKSNESDSIAEMSNNKSKKMVNRMWAVATGELSDENFRRFCRAENKLRLDIANRSIKTVMNWSLLVDEVFPKDSIFRQDPGGVEFFKRFWLGQKKRCEMVLEQIISSGDRRTSIPLNGLKFSSRAIFWTISDQLLCLTISFMRFDDLKDVHQEQAYNDLFKLVQLHPDVEEVIGNDLEAIIKRRKAWRKILGEYNKPSTGRYTSLSLLYRRWGELKRMSSTAVLKYMRDLEQLPPGSQNTETPPEHVVQPNPLCASVVRRFPKILNEPSELWLSRWWVDVAPYYYEEPKVSTDDVEVVESNAPVYEVVDSDPEENDDTNLNGERSNGPVADNSCDGTSIASVPALIPANEDSDYYEDDLIIIPEDEKDPDDIPLAKMNCAASNQPIKSETADDDIPLAKINLAVVDGSAKNDCADDDIPLAKISSAADNISLANASFGSDDVPLAKINSVDDVPSAKMANVDTDFSPSDDEVLIPKQASQPETTAPDAIDYKKMYGIRECHVALQRLDEEVDRILHQLWEFSSESKERTEDESDLDDASIHSSNDLSNAEGTYSSDCNDWKIIQEYLPLSTTLRFKCFSNDNTKNPDFHMHLKQLSLEFLAKNRNKKLMRLCRKLTTDIVRDLNLERLVHYLKRNKERIDLVAMSYSKYKNSILSVRMAAEKVKENSEESDSTVVDRVEVSEMMSVDSNSNESTLQPTLSSTMDGLKMKVFREHKTEPPAMDHNAEIPVYVDSYHKNRCNSKQLWLWRNAKNMREIPRVRAPWLSNPPTHHVNRNEVIKLLKGLQKPQESLSSLDNLTVDRFKTVDQNVYSHQPQENIPNSDPLLENVYSLSQVEYQKVHEPILNLTSEAGASQFNWSAFNVDHQYIPKDGSLICSILKRGAEDDSLVAILPDKGTNGLAEEDHNYSMCKRMEDRTKRFKPDDTEVPGDDRLSAYHEPSSHCETRLMTTAEYFKNANFSSDTEDIT